jgi:hypothetical protein
MWHNRTLFQTASRALCLIEIGASGSSLAGQRPQAEQKGYSEILHFISSAGRALALTMSASRRMTGQKAQEESILRIPGDFRIPTEDRAIQGSSIPRDNEEHAPPV